MMTSLYTAPLPGSSFDNKTLLTFWKHADCIHRLMRTAWRCSCSSVHCVNIQVDPRSFRRNVCMDMVVNFKMVQQPRLWEKLSLSVSHLEPQTVALCCRRPLAVNFNLPNAPTQPTNATSSSVTTVSTSSVAQCQSTTFSESLCILAQRGQAFSLGACVYTLADDATDARYNLFRADCKIASDEAHSLADILSRRCAIELLHMHRLMLAYNITHAFLRSGATPWINDTAMSKALHLPMAPDGQTLLHKQAFVVSHFHHTSTSQPNDNTFHQIGILLLELYINKALEQHP